MLTHEAAIARRNDSESWAIVSGLRIDLGDAQDALEEALSDVESHKAETILLRSELQALSSTSPALHSAPSITEGVPRLSAYDIENASASSGPEDADAPVLAVSSLDSTSSLMAFPPPSSDDLLAVQLPADTSSTSIDGFEPLSPIMETDPYVDDPFTGKKSDPMLAISIFRLTVSAPSSPPHKYASTKRDDWALLHPSASDPTGVGSY